MEIRKKNPFKGERANALHDWEDFLGLLHQGNLPSLSLP